MNSKLSNLDSRAASSSLMGTSFNRDAKISNIGTFDSRGASSEGGSNRFQPPCGVPCTKQILISLPWGTIREIRELTIRFYKHGYNV